LPGACVRAPTITIGGLTITIVTTITGGGQRDSGDGCDGRALLFTPAETQICPGDRPSHGVRLLHPRRDIPLAVKHTPDIDVVRALDVEHEVRVARQRPCAQAGQVEFMGVAG
jgi:hypothetical protein